jgi:hypothetical protein
MFATVPVLLLLLFSSKGEVEDLCLPGGGVLLFMANRDIPYYGLRGRHNNFPFEA